MHPDWARSVRDQCVEAGVPFFFKHWGEWKEKEYSDRLFLTEATFRNPSGYPITKMVKVGKKAAGRLLDGGEWNEFP
jgi:protein gp37